MTDDAPLLPEHWQAVHDALRKLYIGFGLSVVGCGFVGIFFAIAGHRSLRRSGPTLAVRELSRIRLILAVALIGAAALAVATRASVNSTTLRVAAVVPAVAVTTIDIAAWTMIGIALARWAGSNTLVAEWRRTQRVLIALSAAFASGVIEIAVDATRQFGKATIAVCAILFWIQLPFTSWRTYALFSQPLRPTNAPNGPPPPPPPPS